MKPLNEMSAWEEAQHGHLPRIIRVYVKTVIRLKRRKLIPEAIGYGLNDEGWSMFVAHKALNTGFHVSRVLVPIRDEGFQGYMVLHPGAFKVSLRQFLIPQEKVTIQ